MDGEIVIEFGIGGNAPGLTHGGWSPPERGFRWMIGLESFIEVPHPATAARYELSLAVRPHVRPPQLTKQALIVAVNGMIVSVGEIDREMTVSCEVPRWVIELFEGVTLRLIHPNAAAPSAFTNSPDERTLAIAVERLVLRPYVVVKRGEKLRAPQALADATEVGEAIKDGPKDDRTQRS